ncbi:hypothetical protein [Psychrobacter sp. SZ93C1]|uniref:hypothetical protein n=1 Tax=Psychrobacter sp. SZ93C1 TaxID=2792058 RepID=UPI0018CEE2A2|nr:hypothetical protein [Psychrobacter sp. SZ93C1]MBH0065715.1 hypothetical protein [Psychrobacter sp. SZ93C1]
MKPICPCCRSSAVYELSDGTNNTLVESLLSPAMLVSLGVSLCKTLKFHPAIGAVAGIALAAVIEMAQPNNALPILASKQYRCSDCSHVFSSFN